MGHKNQIATLKGHAGGKFREVAVVAELNTEGESGKRME
jgi:hypothetical protein